MPEKNEFRTAEVFAQNVLVGEISETDDGYKFTYDPQYLKSAIPKCRVWIYLNFF